MINVHATCVLLASTMSLPVPADAGVLLVGESGSGKSDLALRLIAGGATLVADDRCELFVVEDQLRARAPQPLRGLLEVRGIGIVPMPFSAEAAVRLVVRMAPPAEIARFPCPARYRPDMKIDLPERGWPPEIALAPFEASAPAKVLSALVAGVEQFGEHSCD